MGGVLVAIKSDARLQGKAYPLGTELWFPFSDRKRLLLNLAAQTDGCPRLFFDDHWRNFQGDSVEIRTATDSFFEGRVHVFRAMGADQVQRFGLDEDPAVIAVSRGSLSSTRVRRWLRSGADPISLPQPYRQLLLELSKKTLERHGGPLQQ